MSTNSDEQLLALFEQHFLARMSDDDTPFVEAGLRAVAAAAWEEGVRATMFGRDANGQMTIRTGPNPYANALVVPPPDQ